MYDVNYLNTLIYHPDNLNPLQYHRQTDIQTDRQTDKRTILTNILVKKKKFFFFAK